MKHANKTKIILFLFVTFMMSQIVSAQKVYTLEEALNQAFSNSPNLIQSKISLEQQKLNLRAQRASLKSQFSLDVDPFSYFRQKSYDSFNSKWYSSESKSAGASFGITQPIKWTDGSISLVNDFKWQEASNKTSGGSNTSFSHDMSIRFTQPLFTYNRTKMNLKELEYSLQNAQMSYAMQQLSIEKSVTSQFYQVYQAQQNLITKKEELKNQRKNYDIIKNKVEAGLVAKEELYQSEVNLATSESAFYTQEISLKNTKDDLKKLLGLDLNKDLSVLPNTNILKIKVFSLDAEKHALEQRMELLQHQISLEKSLFAIIKAKAQTEFNGDLSVRVGLNALSNKVDNMYDNPNDNEQISISFKIPIFDWGAKKARVRSSQLSYESEKINIKEEKKDIILGVRKICRNLPNLEREIEIKQKSIINAQHTYDINLEKYRNGDITGMDLQQYQNQLTTAQQSYTNAIINYKLEVLNLKIQTLWDYESQKSILPEEIKNIKL